MIIENLFYSKEQIVILDNSESIIDYPIQLFHKIFNDTKDYIKTSTILRLKYNIKTSIAFKQNINK